MIIGLSGYARTGKDEAANILVDEFGFKRVAFADKLRDVLYALNPIVKQEQDAHFTRNVNTTDVQTVIDRHGWDGYKQTEFGSEIRRLLQRLGTEAGRQTLWDSIWVDAALNGIDKNDNICITDCRFINEADTIRSRGGIVVRVSRPGVGPVNDHISERGLDEYSFDYHLNNDGSLIDYKNSITNMMKEI